MTNQQIPEIPIAEIRVVNPRSRNRITFQLIMTSIAKVGLKKPITVHERVLEEDGTRYDLVCGQGRLEAVRELGGATIWAIIDNQPEDKRFLMSLVENLARKQASTTDLLREIKRLTARHFKAPAIAKRLGIHESYIYGVMNLLKHGEEGLVMKVEAGRLPIDTAMTIATGTDEDVQRALSDAYEKGTLRGAKLRAVQQLIARRKTHAEPSEANRQITGDDLLREYERHTQQQRALVRRSAIIAERLAVITSSLQRLLSDDHFVTLLRAEGLRTMPAHLAARLAARA